ncbi:molybdopterin molybdotransferase MoeA [Sphingopyxis sp. GC21]|uniref:molybdopterin molybdotransferase MoeA n=1 Tax=Sphingopyxis sp. GC21 TaxID=2933562 RepID=UPI0021E3E987|nr:molybdopterin molybdotransferase MoeA [Sphingopyxis sp. GC21]
MDDKISVAEALDRIDRHLLLSPPERLAVDADAQGHILSAPVAAAADTPRFDCSAMDGFAISSGATRDARAAAPAIFALAEDIPAAATARRLQPGSAAPISTGAPIPADADGVAAKERCLVIDGALHLSEPITPWCNVRRRGEDAPAGKRVAEAGHVLSPELIGALLGYGVTHVEARRPARIDVLATGSELVSPADAVGSARMDSNGPMIGAMCRSLGLECRVSAPMPDDLTLLCRQIASREEFPPADMLVSTGGVSVGKHDLVREALDRIGARIIFHGIAMRPGKPILFALLPDGRPFFGLPGNPVAALVGFRFFVLAAVRRMIGLPREEGCLIATPTAARGGTTLFLRARRGRTNRGSIKLLDDQRSHVMGSVVAADCWLRIDDTQNGPVAALFEQAPKLR